MATLYYRSPKDGKFHELSTGTKYIIVDKENADKYYEQYVKSVLSEKNK